MDIDGVLLDTVGMFLEIYNTKHNTAFKHEDMTNWDLNVCLGEPTKVMWETFKQITTDDRWGAVQLCDPYAPTLLRKLRNSYAVDLVTARTRESIIPVLERLDTLGCEWDSVCVVDYKNYNEKAKYANDYVAFVDDSPHNYTSITEAGGRVLIYDQPWNRHLEGKRVTSMFEVGREIFYGK